MILVIGLEAERGGGGRSRESASSCMAAASGKAITDALGNAGLISSDWGGRARNTGSVKAATSGVRRPLPLEQQAQQNYQVLPACSHSNL